MRLYLVWLSICDIDTVDCIVDNVQEANERVVQIHSYYEKNYPYYSPNCWVQETELGSNQCTPYVPE